jgi:hypothetical protein
VLNSDNLTLNFNTSAGTASPVGSYAIVPVVVDPTGKLGNYNVTSTNGNLTVNRAPLIGTADDKSRPYGDANPPFTVTYSGFVNGETVAVVSGTLVGTTPATSASPIGTYPISVSGQTAQNYAISYVDGLLTITRHALTVTPNNTNRPYGASNPEMTGIVTGLQNGDAITAAYSSTATPASLVGQYPITATLIDPDSKLNNYTVTLNEGILTVGKATLTVTAANTTRLYGASNPTLNGTINGTQNGDTFDATYATSATVTSSVGNYSIVPTLVDPNGKAGNYSVILSNGIFSVTRAPLTIAAADVTRGFGSPNPPLTGTITGVLNGDNITATYTTDATQSSEVGSYAIIPAAVDPNNKLGNYSLTLDIGTLSIVSAGVVSISIIDGQAHVFGSADPNLTYKIEASSDLTTWTEVGSITAAGNGGFEFVDPAAATLGARFYRALAQ